MITIIDNVPSVRSERLMPLPLLLIIFQHITAIRGTTNHAKEEGSIAA
jgi:hypothetical protein